LFKLQLELSMIIIDTLCSTGHDQSTYMPNIKRLFTLSTDRENVLKFRENRRPWVSQVHRQQEHVIDRAQLPISLPLQVRQWGPTYIHTCRPTSTRRAVFHERRIFPE